MSAGKVDPNAQTKVDMAEARRSSTVDVALVRDFIYGEHHLSSFRTGRYL